MTAEEITRYVVAKAVWAPSVHNTQPWRFTSSGQQISLHADADRRLAVADPDGREMMISCGAALFNVRLALRSLGYIPETCVLPDPGQPALVARVSWRAARRRRRVRAAAVRLCARAADASWRVRPGAVATGHARRAARGRRAGRGGAAHRGGRRAAGRAGGRRGNSRTPAAARDGERFRELARWAPPPGSARSDGVPATSYPARAEHTEPYFPGRDFAHGHGWGLPPLSTATSYRAAGVAGLLTTAADRPVDWVNAGQALQRILLTASTCGAAVALHSQPLELPWLREFIRTQLSDGAYPHLVLRIGLVTQVAVSVRREPDDVLFSTDGDRVEPRPRINRGCADGRS